MNARIKLFATSFVSPYVALIASLLCMGIMVVGGDQRWKDDFYWTTEWIEGSLFPALLATLCALGFDCWRHFNPARPSYFDSRTGRRRGFLGALIACNWLALILPAVVLFLQSYHSWRFGPPSRHWSAAGHFTVCMIALLALLLACAVLAVRLPKFGALVGPLVTGVAAFAALSGHGIFLLGSTTGPMLDVDARARVLWALGACAVVAAICGALLLRAGGTGASASGMGAWVLLGVLLAQLLVHVNEYEFTTSGTGACQDVGGSRRVCISAEHQRFFTPVVARYEELVDAAEATGNPQLMDALPRMYAETIGHNKAWRFTPGLGPEDQSSYRISRGLADATPSFSREEFIASLATNSHCDTPNRAAAQESTELLTSLLDAPTSLSPERTARLAELLPAIRACHA
ncbi:hypothetical protein ACUY3K_04700 [Corynebacterium uberis]|uniref:hypothetical protein n=1 Tax=Corynebacterium TaxID=1716 RepID=UPI001D0AF264|nr:MULTISPECIES: hypothetical protein [Corynebacterium]MCZ9309610.1 hypothetical protein [Corynebacterium sp. c6VSa_13]UDL73417.1 hypothetical protein LH391_10105 [Corynebacterium uberis]UDL75703.1 hypothetical protein LH393_10820 [Corynebacterium uberis]UDL77916.1 hypothetical protein LH394_10805 [Corynebacterium uberis]UDL80199.1 hypothetical protein LH392_11225 [Corynebacterium uberis]